MLSARRVTLVLGAGAAVRLLHNIFFHKATAAEQNRPAVRYLHAASTARAPPPESRRRSDRDLERKARFIREGRLVFAKEELLAYRLVHVDADGEHDFVRPEARVNLQEAVGLVLQANRELVPRQARSR